MDKESVLKLSESLLSLKAQIKALKDIMVEQGITTDERFEELSTQIEKDMTLRFYKDLSK